MAPSPEDDNTPKAPDKSDKNKCEKAITDEILKENDKDEKTLSNLNDGELKALLDEALTYKNPKDRVGKSKLFKDLLIQAEEHERIARATSAGGSELVRHCNPSARRNAAVGSQRHHQGRRKSSRRMASETVMHGGSLDNLAQEELFLESAHNLMIDKPNKRTAVSARQREGGSLPCDVNSSLSLGPANQFFEEAKRKKAMKEKPDYSGGDIETYETQRLLDHDTLAQNYEEETQEVPKFVTRATLQISATPVDDPIPLDLDSGADKKAFDVEALHNKVSHSKYSVFIPTYNKTPEDKKLDENGNPVHQNNPKTKKKKKENVVVLNAESVEGHRSDIINDVDKLIQFIGGGDETISTSKPKSNFHKSKQLKQHFSEDIQRGGGNTNTGGGGGGSGSGGKKQRAHSSKGKETRGELKKSNSLGEISTTKLDNFDFSTEKEENNKVVLRTGKNVQTDRPKERRSWGNVEPPPFQVRSSNASTENLETTENWVVTKPKKKSKKRRNSISSGARRQNSASESTKQPANRAPSPDLRGNATRSVPHSEKSNDSSDADSVHSLPIDDLNVPISYADIAKNSEKLKEKKSSPEKIDIKPAASKEKSPLSSSKIDQEVKVQQQNAKKTPVVVEKSPQVDKSVSPHSTHHHVACKTPPDVNNMKNFPAISPETTKVTSAFNSPTLKSSPDEIAIKTDSKPHNQDVDHKILVSTPSIDVSTKVCTAETARVQENAVKNQQPPDVHNIRSFPAMPNANKSLNVTEKICSSNAKNTNGNNNSNVSPLNNKIRNNSPGSINNNSKNNNGSGGNNNNSNNNGNSKGARSGNSNNSSKSSARNASTTNALQNDIQNDLTIIHSNEKESIQFNAQMLPPDIPDVRTIEKMHFMNLTPPPNSIQINAANNNQNQYTTNSKNSPHPPATLSSSNSTSSSPPSSVHNAHAPQVSPEPTSVINNTTTTTSNNNNNNNNKQTVNSNNNNNNNSVNTNANYVNCDNSSERTLENDSNRQQHIQQQQQQQPQNVIDNINVSREENYEDRPPPVVILSGFGNKEVPGLVFGFDINEQLLNEDICENFISRYIEPETFKNSSHNHDKIVNFIGSAWEAIIAQSNGKVQYYKEES